MHLGWGGNGSQNQGAAMTTSISTYQVETNLQIPMRDGTHLAARMYLPEAPEVVPAVVSMMPYHKDGMYRSGYLDDAHQQFASQGYAALAVDLRGIGNSEGHASNAFAAGERLDGYDVIEWLASQPWCSGSVGMWGVSYGGITALSTASARPPSLKAIIPIHAATDMYHDYLVSRGCRTAFSPDVHWGIRMAASNLLPPLHDDPRADELWHDRLNSYRPWILDWHEHTTYDDYWQQAVILPERIEAPTYIVGGWRDIFSDIGFRVYGRLSGPKRILVGPWKHVFPDLAAQAPIGFVSEMCRWWDRWLREEPNGIDVEPPIAHYLYGAEEWRHEQQWPPIDAQLTDFTTSDNGMLARGSDDSEAGHAPIAYEYTPLVGFDTVAMHWLPGPDEPVYAPSDEQRSLCFDTEPLDATVDLIGTPIVRLNVVSSKPNPPLVARLFQRDADGHSQLITIGWFKEQGGDGDPLSAPVESGEPREIEFELRPISWRLLKGSILRLTISCADLSRIWPESHDFTIELHRSRLTLPLMLDGKSKEQAPEFSLPALSPSSIVFSRERQFDVTRDLLEPIATLKTKTSQTHLLDDDMSIEADLTGELRIDGQHPEQSTLTANAVYSLQRAEGSVQTEASMVETSDSIQVEVKVIVDDACIYSRTWNRVIGDSGNEDATSTDG